MESDGVKSFQIWVHLFFSSRFISYRKKKKKNGGRPVKAHEAQTVSKHPIWCLFLEPVTPDASDRSLAPSQVNPPLLGLVRTTGGG
jgi:hypothetical protein